jgi:ATP-dependent RNA helicase DbpA
MSSGQRESDAVEPARFGALGMRPELLVGIERLGFTEMTDIQARALPAALAGRDLVGTARTGSGKTTVFGLALLQRLDLADRSPQALILCPTRELAQQLTGVIRSLAVGLEGARVIPITGGAPSRPQRDALEAGAHVIIGTPGRVLHNLEMGRIATQGLRCLVLDEADRMLDMGFEEEVNAIIATLPTDRQTLLFTATWPPAMSRLSARIQQDPEEVGAKALVDDALLRQSAIFCERQARRETLCMVLADRTPVPTLVFCETRQQCNELTEYLRQQGAAALTLHGELEQRDRDDVLARLRNESARILVATNVAARGLDLDGLGLVVCFELSPDPSVHIHRVGRTARASAQGEAVSLVAGPREARRLDDIEALVGSKIPRVDVSGARTVSLAAWTAPYRTLAIRGGRKDKLRPGDILGALTRDVKLAGDDVGKIEVKDHRSWVAVRSAVAARAATALSATRIKKRRFRVHLVK